MNQEGAERCPAGDEEEFVWALWVALICQCEECRQVLFLHAIEHLLDSDPPQWSEAAAREAMRVGWRHEQGKILCPACRAVGLGT